MPVEAVAVVASWSCFCEWLLRVVASVAVCEWELFVAFRMGVSIAFRMGASVAVCEWELLSLFANGSFRCFYRIGWELCCEEWELCRCRCFVDGGSSVAVANGSFCCCLLRLRLRTRAACRERGLLDAVELFDVASCRGGAAWCSFFCRDGASSVAMELFCERGLLLSRTEAFCRDGGVCCSFFCRDGAVVVALGARTSSVAMELL